MQLRPDDALPRDSGSQGRRHGTGSAICRIERLEIVHYAGELDAARAHERMHWIPEMVVGVVG